MHEVRERPFKSIIHRYMNVAAPFCGRGRTKGGTKFEIFKGEGKNWGRGSPLSFKWGPDGRTNERTLGIPQVFA